MNQHASRPVAQGFPLHRRLNGHIQSSSGPSRTNPLRPSNPSFMTSEGSSLRRSLGLSLKSQIPIRIQGFGAQSSHQNFLRTRALRVLEQQRRQSLLSSTTQNSATAATAIQPSSSSSTSQQPIDTAFKVYEDRLQSDLRHFHAICTRLILQEREEKEKWHTLCLKMMKERDTARQRLSTLIGEREAHLLSSSVPATASTSIKENVQVPSSKASKRARDEASSAPSQELLESSTTTLPSDRSTFPVESRPIRSLRSSPIPSPPGSPSTSSYNSTTLINSSSPIQPSTSSQPSPPPPSSDSASSTVPLPSSSTTTFTPCLEDSSSTIPPLNIITFNPARSPNDKTCFDVYGEFDIPETRPVKRRKSYDATSSSSSSDKKEKTVVQTTNDARESKDALSSAGPSNKGDDDAVPFSISHTDIMYMPMKGRLFCRACLN